LKHFYIDNVHPLSTPIVVWLLDAKKDHLRPLEEDEEILSPEVPYLSVIGALMYLVNYTRPDIAFTVNLLARYNFTPTKTLEWGPTYTSLSLRNNKIGLFYSGLNSQLIGYAATGYLSDPHKERSQTSYLFTYRGTAFS